MDSKSSPIWIFFAGSTRRGKRISSTIATGIWFANCRSIPAKSRSGSWPRIITSFISLRETPTFVSSVAVIWCCQISGRTQSCMVSRCSRKFRTSESVFIDSDSVQALSVLKIAALYVMTRLPLGPKSRYPGRIFLKFRQDPIGFLEKAAAQFGDVVHWKMGGQNIFLINDPDLIRDVLVTQDKKFEKQMEASRTLLGLGLTVRKCDVQ